MFSYKFLCKVDDWTTKRWLGFLAILYNEARGAREEMTEERFIQLTTTSLFLGAADEDQGGKIVGVGRLFCDQPEKGWGTIADVFVSPSFPSEEVRRRIVELLVHEAKRIGLTYLISRRGDNYELSNEFFTRLGFVQTDRGLIFELGPKR